MSKNDEGVLINFRISKSKRKALKAIAVEKEVTITDMIMGFIDKVIEKSNK